MTGFGCPERLELKSVCDVIIDILISCIGRLFHVSRLQSGRLLQAAAPPDYKTLRSTLKLNNFLIFNKINFYAKEEV